MFKIILFDVGETLIHDGAPLAQVVEAMHTLAGFVTDSGYQLLFAMKVFRLDTPNCV